MVIMMGCGAGTMMMRFGSVSTVQISDDPNNSTDYDLTGARTVARTTTTTTTRSWMNDLCQTGDLGWTSNNTTTDHDGDGCQDSGRTRTTTTTRILMWSTPDEDGMDV